MEAKMSMWSKIGQFISRKSCSFFQAFGVYDFFNNFFFHFAFFVNRPATREIFLCYFRSRLHNSRILNKSASLVCAYFLFLLSFAIEFFCACYWLIYFEIIFRCHYAYRSFCLSSSPSPSFSSLSLPLVLFHSRYLVCDLIFFVIHFVACGIRLSVRIIKIRLLRYYTTIVHNEIFNAEEKKSALAKKKMK